MLRRTFAHISRYRVPSRYIIVDNVNAYNNIATTTAKSNN